MEQKLKRYEGEIWKKVEGFDYYEVSSIGRVRSLPHRTTKGKILKQSKTKNGYLRIVLRQDDRKNNFLVHRLVASAFLPRNSYNQINHIDGNKTNNILSNLEWCSASHNMKHRSFVVGTGQKPKDELKYKKIFKLKDKGLSDMEISKIVGMSYNTVYWVTHYSMMSKARQALKKVGVE